MEVLPASAGMILVWDVVSALGSGAPRIRGDDPYRNAIEEIPYLCSPHPRG